MRLILYSKPGCHLCEGLQEKLEQICSLSMELEVRDITQRPDWFQAYQYEVPVLFLQPDQAEKAGAEAGAIDGGAVSSVSPPMFALPRPSPRASVGQLEQMLQRYLLEYSKNESE